MNGLDREHHIAPNRRARAPKLRQLTIHRRGGARPGAGRKPKGLKALVSHRTRPELSARHPVLVTMKLCDGLPSLRREREREVIWTAFEAAGERFGLRIVHFSIQSTHIHMIVEARDAESLSRGMQGLSVRVARGLNRAWRRKGRVFHDRYHAEILSSPRRVRHALSYVLNNARKHGWRFAGIDVYSSGAAFDGWREPLTPWELLHKSRLRPPPVRPAGTWLLATGWRRHGLIGVGEIPGGHRGRSRLAQRGRLIAASRSG